MPQKKRRRGKAEQQQWLEDKRSARPADGGPAGAPDAGGAPRVDVRKANAEEDFRAYYGAQRLFGEGPPAAAELEELWRVMHTPLPVTVRVRHSPGARLEARLRLLPFFSPPQPCGKYWGSA